MTYNANGQLMLTVVTGSSYTGLYAADGSYNVVLTTENTTIKGLHHPCGAYWATVVTDPYTSYYAIDGSMNIIQNSDSSYSPIYPNGAAGGGGGNLPNPPTGFLYLLGADGAYLLGTDGAYLLGAA